MKITPDNLARLKEAAKILSSLPFSASVEALLGKLTVWLYIERKEFEENFPDYKIETVEGGTFLEAEQDGISFSCFVPKEKDYD